MQAGIAGSRRTLASLLAAAIVAAMFVVLGGSVADAGHEPPDATLPQDPDANHTPYWVTYLNDVRGIDGADCEKLDQNSSSAFVMPSPPDGQEWVLLVVKQSTTNFLYYDPVGGHTYPSIGQQGPGYSHIIMCSAESATTTTEASTTTSLDVGATSTTAGPTTTAGGPTTTIEPTTTTAPTTTTTLGDEVLGTTITTAGSTTTVANVTGSTFEDEVLDEEILPFTGLAFEGLIIVASALALLGALLLSTRGQLED